MTIAEAKRSKPKSQIVFPVPLVGPSGAALTSYVWQWTLEEVVDGRGELVERRVSDWEASTENALTGREIVHQFEVGDQLVSAESALKLLGFTASTGKPFKAVKSATQTLAKLLMAQSQLEAKRQRWQRDIAEVEALALPVAIPSEWQQCDGHRRREWTMGDIVWTQIHNELGCDSDDEVIGAMAADWRALQMEARGWGYCYRNRRAERRLNDEARDLAKRIAKAETRIITAVAN